MSAQPIAHTDLPPPVRCDSMSDCTSMFSGATMDSAEVETPDDSPYASVEVVNTDIDAMDFGPMFNHATPRAKQDNFLDLDSPQANAVDSPSKHRSLSRVVGKAKGMVKAFIQRRPTRKMFNRELATFIPESASTMAMSSAVPGGWQEGTVRERQRLTQSMFIRPDDIASPTKRVWSNSSLKGIYNPEHPVSPVASLVSFFRSQLSSSASDLLPGALDEATAQSADSPGGALEHEVEEEENHPLRSPLVRTAQAIVFVPWCLTVGGAILLFPRHLELCVFGPGYHCYRMPSPRGFRRFVFLTETVPEFVKMFFMCLALLCYYDLRHGTIVVLAALARLVFVWSDFSLPTCCMPSRLGDDDMESLWVIVSGQADDMIARYIDLCCSQSQQPAADDDEGDVVPESD